MKTTLKKGIGRTAGANGNGNGRAVLPPSVVAPPPSAPPPSVSVYRQPPRRRRGLVGVLVAVLGWLVSATAVAAAGVAGGLYLYTDNAADDLRATTPDLVRAQQLLDVVVAGEPATALVIGSDFRLGVESEVNGARSDTIMLIRVDPTNESVSMLSFPRDLRVELHCPGKPVRGGRINEAYSDCGVPGTLATVRELTDVPINYIITVDFHGFKQVVARLGGVWLDVDRRYFNDNSRGENYAEIDLQPGYQKLNGEQALSFVRYRHTDSDIYRLARQQQFLRSFTTAVTSSINASRVTDIVDVVRDNVEVGQAGGGAISKRSLISYGLLAYELPKGRFFQARIDMSCYGEDDVSEITVDPSCIRDAVRDFTLPDVDASEKATQVALGQKPKETAPAPKNTTVVVLNGNGVAGAAADTSFQLAQRAYVTLTPPNNAPANAPSTYPRSVVYYDASQSGAEAAAAKLADVVGGADVEPIALEIQPLSNGAMLVLVVGQTFTGQVAPVPVDKTPQRRPPDTVENPALTEALVRDAQKAVRWPLLVPAVVERTSTLSQSAPIRAYRIAGYRTVRLTFGTGAGEFWGVQMVKWGRAPVLRDPNRKLFVKGRRYELHYAGSNLHMVVLRQNGATYWVVNTLMNSLSNETMLEIAKGLRPLGPS